MADAMESHETAASGVASASAWNPGTWGSDLGFSANEAEELILHCTSHVYFFMKTVSILENTGYMSGLVCTSNRGLENLTSGTYTFVLSAASSSVLALPVKGKRWGTKDSLQMNRSVLRSGKLSLSLLRDVLECGRATPFCNTH